MITIEKTSPTYSYDEIGIPIGKIRVSYAFNNSYILEIQVEYSRIFLIRITYMSVKEPLQMRIVRMNSLKHS